MAHQFYICDSVFKENEIKIFHLENDSFDVQGVRTNALPQMTHNAMRVLLNSIIKMMGDTDYTLHAILVTGSRNDVLGYELNVHDDDLALQFKLAHC